MGRAIAILGMHRSGTSAVSGLLNTLGVYLGSGDLLGGAGSDNPKGFFEFNPFLEINETLLQRVNSSWNNLPSPMPDWAGDPAFADLREEAARRARQYFTDVPLWAFKDPRTCVTLPFWRAAVPAISDALLVLRHPLEVADSLASRNAMPREQSMALWFTHVVASIRGSAGLRRHILFYEDLLEDLAGEVGRLIAFTGLSFPDGARWQAVKDLVTQDLRHHRRTKMEIEGRSDLPEQAIKLFRDVREYVDLARKGDAGAASLDRLAGDG